MSAWSQIDCSPVNPVFTAVPWALPTMWTTVIKTLVSTLFHKMSMRWVLKVMSRFTRR